METIQQPFICRNPQGEKFFACLKRQFQEMRNLCSLSKVGSVIAKNPHLYKEVVIKGSNYSVTPLVALASDLHELPQNTLLSNEDGSFEVYIEGMGFRKVQLVCDFAHSKGCSVAAIWHQKAKGKLGYQFVEIEGLGQLRTLVLCGYKLKIKKPRSNFGRAILLTN
jgi:hypothetical protein